MSVALKVYERIVEKRVRDTRKAVGRITEWLQKRKELPKSYVYIKTNFGKNVHEQKIYVDFVYIQQAFDSVPRKQIWQSLRKREMKTKLRNNIKSIYEVNRNCEEG